MPTIRGSNRRRNAKSGVVGAVGFAVVRFRIRRVLVRERGSRPSVVSRVNG
jgi:hypothetical protein